jgi:hypothetical protein
MAVENYAGMRELVIAKQAEQEFQQGFKKIRDTVSSYGFDKAAVDSLAFKVSEHMLFVTEDERRGGAFHIHADGKPFYAVTLTAAGSLMDLSASNKDMSPIEMPADQQTILLAFELGMNIFPKMGQVLKEFYGQQDDKVSGGVSSEMMRLNFETTMRCDPKIYCQALNDAIGARLNMIAPKQAVTPKISKPSPKLG